MIARFTATVRKADEGDWVALADIGDKHSVFGSGETREAAIENLREGIAGEIEYLKSKGESLPQSSVEVVNIEVAV
jgi:predicted RNase H-like HicB family nuclease